MTRKTFSSALFVAALLAVGGYIATETIADIAWSVKGRASRIDLSAWVSGMSFGGGLAIANPADAAHDVLSGGPCFFLMLAAFAAFLLIVLLVQRYMRLSLFANSFGSPRRLVTTGVFRLSRNPIYVAFLIPIASIAYVSPQAAIATASLYIMAMNMTVIRREEAQLLAAFGPEYAVFQAATPRWLI